MLDYSYLKPLFSGKIGKTLMTALYYAVDFDSDRRRSAFKYLNKTSQTFQHEIDELRRKGVLDVEYSYSYYGYTYDVSPEQFFPLAVAALQLDRSGIEKMASALAKGKKRSSYAEFLWVIAYKLFEGEKDIASKVAGKFRDGECALYLQNMSADCGLEGFFMRLDNDEIKNYISEQSNCIVYYNQPKFDTFDTLRSLFDRYCDAHKELTAGDKSQVYSHLEAMRFLMTAETKALPLGLKEDYPLIAVRAIKSLYAGQNEKAVQEFEESLKKRNKLFKDKNVYSNPVFAFYLILAYKKCADEKSKTKIAQYLNKKVIRESNLQYPSRLVATYLCGEESEEKIESGVKWLCDERLLPVLNVLGAIIGCYYSVKCSCPPSNSVLLALELASVSGVEGEDVSRLEALCGGKALLPSFRRIEPWEVMLNDMESLLKRSEPGNGSDGEEQDNRRERIGYFMGNRKYNGEYTVEPRIQTRLKSGLWGAGRRAPQWDYYYGKIPCMDDTDKQIAAANLSDGFYSDLKSSRVLPYLIGSDRVYGGTSAPYYNIEVVSALPYVSVKKEGGVYKISSNFPLGELRSGKNASCTLLSKHKAEVISLTEIQKQLLSTISRLPSIPLNATDRLQPLLESISKHIEVHSDLLEGGSSLENLKGNSVVRLKLNPCNNGDYELHVCVRPLDGGDQEFFPAHGAKVIYDQRDGKRYQVSRILSAERRNLETLSDFFSDELDLDVSELMTLSPLQMLSLTQWAQNQENVVAMEWPHGKKIKVRNMASSRLGIHCSSGEQWFEAEGEINFSDGGEILPLETLLALVGEGKLNGNYVQLDEQTYVCLTDVLKKQISKLEAVCQKGKGGVRISRFNVGVLADVLRSGSMDVEADSSLESLERKINESQSLEVSVPKEMNAVLRDYQLQGFRWMVRLDHWGAGACLADDMGLGKTLQAIAFLLYKKTAGASLVVCPASVVMNWRSELARFAPSLNVYVLNSEANRKEVIDNAAEGDVVLSSYGLLAYEDQALLSKDWNVVCLDEAHTIKNRQTRTSASAMQLRAGSRIILTGTPVQNYLGELWNLMQFLNPGLLGTFESFRTRYMGEGDNIENLKRIVQPFVLRRTKAEVLSELPDKTEIVRMVQLTDAEMLLYESMRQKVNDQLQTETKMNVSVLSQITRLRQAACSMALIDKNWSGATSKLSELSSLLEEILSGGNRVLIFSQFTSFLDLVNASLASSGTDYYYLNGSTPIPEREKMVREFQKGKKSVFVVSLKAGGLGLNLTGANYVIHLDPWWNPAIEQQATDRAYRIGQRQNVTVYHLIAAHTIEEKILRLHDRKKQLSESFLEGTDIAKTISLQDLRDLCAE